MEHEGFSTKKLKKLTPNNLIPKNLSLEKYLHTIAGAYQGYWQYLTGEILHPRWHNYFYWLVGASVVIWLLEIAFPWRKNQPLIRQDFWMDAFYLIWNYFLFSLIAYNALSMVGVELFNDFLGLFGITNIVAIEVGGLPTWAQLLLIFVIRDFLQWNIHRLLHHVPWMWEFHKVHHSVKRWALPRCCGFTLWRISSTGLWSTFRWR